MVDSVHNFKILDGRNIYTDFEYSIRKLKFLSSKNGKLIVDSIIHEELNSYSL